MTPTDKKRRGDKASLYNRLATDERRAQVASWLTIENLTYKDARELVESQLGISTSEDALRRFYSSFAVPWQYAQASNDAESFGQLMEGNFDAATIKRAKQLAFSALTERKPDVKTAKALLKIVGDSAKHDIAKERLALDDRKVKLLEAKARKADETEGIVKDATLTPAEKEARVKAVFGIS